MSSGFRSQVLEGLDPNLNSALTYWVILNNFALYKIITCTILIDSNWKHSHISESSKTSLGGKRYILTTNSLSYTLLPQTPEAATELFLLYPPDTVWNWACTHTHTHAQTHTPTIYMFGEKRITKEGERKRNREKNLINLAHLLLNLIIPKSISFHLYLTIFWIKALPYNILN